MVHLHARAYSTTHMGKDSVSPLDVGVARLASRCQLHASSMPARLGRRFGRMGCWAEGTLLATPREALQAGALYQLPRTLPAAPSTPFHLLHLTNPPCSPCNPPLTQLYAGLTASWPGAGRPWRSWWARCRVSHHSLRPWASSRPDTLATVATRRVFLHECAPGLPVKLIS